MSRLKVYGILICLILAAAGAFGFSFYRNYYAEASSSPRGQYQFKVEKGDTIRTISDKLSKQKVIPSGDSLSFHNQFHPVDNLQTGNFSVNLPATPKNILEQIDIQNQLKIKALSENKKPSVSLTFKEGISADQVLDLISKAGLGERNSLAKFIQEPSNFDKSKYPFLPTPLTCQYGERNNCAKYYLEGYLYPDTYTFFTDSKPTEVFDKFLINFQNRVWINVQKNEQSSPDSNSFAKSIIEASIIEKETGRPISGITKDNIDEVTQERKNVASVLNNRNSQGMKWESNPTVGYWDEKQVCEQTIVIDDCILLNDPLAQTLYNTYNNPGYPIGAITSPTFDSINAALNPNQTNDLYFVAQNSGKTYFASDENGHLNNIELVKSKNLE